MVCMGVVVAGWNTVVRIPRSVVSIIAPVAVPAVGERNSNCGEKKKRDNQDNRKRPFHGNLQ